MDIERVKQIAYNRWELRKEFHWRENENDKDDWRVAEHIVQAEELAKQKEAACKNEKVKL
jgi:hypothetical protein